MAPDSGTPGRWGLEWWYASQFAVGVVFMGMVPVLVPAYVLSVSNSASAAGVVMAILGLGALAAPVIGSFADRYRAHRAAQLGGVAALIVGAALFAGAKEEMVFALAAVALGLGVASVLMVNPTFIVAAGFEPGDEATRLGRLTQTAMVGQLIGGTVAAGLAAAKVEFESRFWVMAAIAAAALVLTAFTNAQAARRINVDPAAQAEEVREEATGPSLWAILGTAFGILVVANFFNSVGHATLQSQYPNFMSKAFGIGQSASATALSVGAVVILIAIGFLGRIMGAAGAANVLRGAWILRLAAFVGLAVLVGTSVPAILPLGLYILLAVGIQFNDAANPAMAVRTSPTTAGAAQGFVMGALALGTFSGGLLGGVLAESVGFDWLPVAGAVSVAIAVALSIPGFRGVDTRKPVVVAPGTANAS
jgi:predicted MFS family arabinose efflux permease